MQELQQQMMSALRYRRSAQLKVSGYKGHHAHTYEYEWTLRVKPWGMGAGKRLMNEFVRTLTHGRAS